MSVSRRAAILGLTVASLPFSAPALAQRRQMRRSVPTGRSVVAPVQTYSFGPDPLQAYDVYADRGAGPILMFVHGGGWSRGERSMVSELPGYAQRHSFTLASTSYRLAPAVSPREAAMDVAAAVADLRRRLPGRPIYLLGHSAGAHLAALVGIDADYLGAAGLQPTALAGIILLDGAGYDATASRGDGLVGQWLGRIYDQAFSDQAAALSPTLRVRPGAPYPPFLIFHVARRQDSTVQSHALAEALIRAGGRAEVVAAPDDSHMTINRGFGVAGDPEGERAARFISG